MQGSTIGFPKIFRLRQTFDAACVEDVAGEVHRELARLELGEKIRPGQSVAITAGSRGIDRIAVITRAIVEHFKQLGAKPFIVPAMGSHGGGTAQGQRELVESYGVTKSFVGCPIRSSTETVIVGRAAEGFDIHFDKIAFEADHVMICNRVKPHTGFMVGQLESGLVKMLLIGLGKCEGARVYHRAVLDLSFDQVIDSVAGEVIEKCHVLAGLAIVENAYDRVAHVEALRPEQFVAREKELLALAKRLMPRLPFQHVDVLLIDRIGKDISGTGFDPNIAGRKYNDHKAIENEWPKVRRIALRGLTEATHGNAHGLGMAEFCRSQLLRETDFAAVRLNGLTSGHIGASMPPFDYETDREMLAAALNTIGLTAPPDAKLLWITDTLHLGEMECSTAFYEEAQQRDDLQILTEPRDMPFDAEGNMTSMGTTSESS